MLQNFQFVWQPSYTVILYYQKLYINAKTKGKELVMYDLYLLCILMEVFNIFLWMNIGV